MKEKCRLVDLFESQSRDTKYLRYTYYFQFSILHSLYICTIFSFAATSLPFVLLLLVSRHQLFDGHVRFVFQTFLFLVRI